jgi:hypothetical protein
MIGFKCLPVIVALGILISYSFAINGIYAQIKPTTTNQTAVPSSGSTAAASSVTVTVPVSNQTITTTEGKLRSAVVSSLNAGPNVLKTSENAQANTKSKITNQINNATQIVEGIEATNAIVGVEIGKSLRSVISENSQKTQAPLVTVTTSSSCKPAGTTVSCENTISIKRP